MACGEVRGGASPAHDHCLHRTDACTEQDSPHRPSFFLLLRRVQASDYQQPQPPSAPMSSAPPEHAEEPASSTSPGSVEPETASASVAGSGSAPGCESELPSAPVPNFFGEFFGFALKNAGLTEAELRGGQAPVKTPSDSNVSGHTIPGEVQSLSHHIAADGHGLDCGNGLPPSEPAASVPAPPAPAPAPAAAATSVPSSDAASLASLLERTLTALSVHEQAQARALSEQVPSSRVYDGSLASFEDGEEEEVDDLLTASMGRSASATRAGEGVRASSLTRALRHAAHTPRGLPTAPVAEQGVPDSGAMTPGTPSIDQHGLGWPAARTLDRLHSTPAAAKANQARLAGAVATILQCLGEDPQRPGLKETPMRYAKALLWMTRGYETKLDGACGTRDEALRDTDWSG